MKHAMTRRRARRAHRALPTWRQPTMLAGAAVLAGAALGMGGSTLALWQDQAGFSVSARSGYEYFAAGAPGQTQPATNGTVEFTVGAEHAAKLQSDRQIAIPLETESISQGNKGLRYTITEPDWGDHFFGAAATTLFQVPSAQDCTVEGAPDSSREQSSTPVSADYSDTEDPVVETWCLVATIEDLPDEGTYSNSVTAKAEDPAGTSVEATDTWHAEVTSSMNPDDEPNHVITFEYETFRPGTAD